MFLIPMVLLDFGGRFKHVFVSSMSLSQLVGYIACEDVGG